MLLTFESDCDIHGTYLRKILGLHPAIISKDLSFSIRASNKRRKIGKQPIDLNAFFEDKSFSDRELFQIMGYTLHRVNLLKNRWDDLLKANKDYLNSNGILFGTSGHKNVPCKFKGRSPVARLAFFFRTDPTSALSLIHQNFLVIARENRLEKRTSALSNNILALKRSNINLFFEYVKFLEENYEPTSRYIDMPRETFKNYLALLTLKSPINEFTFILAVMLQTGINSEVATTIKRFYDGVHWKDRFDINLGIDSQTALKKKVLRLTGVKSKGINGKKPIDIRVPVDSYLYSVLELWETIFSADDSETFYSGTHINNSNRDFCDAYSIIADDHSQITSISSRKIRKVFAGSTLAKLVEENISGPELTRKMRDALNHESFDTTVFSYLMKTGTGNLVYSSAVIALTNKMIEEALAFQGKIELGAEKEASTSRIPVYLCDCDDPSAPTHDVPISDRCRHYDLCLGCERSTVYAEHIPRICYRVMQYEKVPQPTDIIVVLVKSNRTLP